MIDKGLTSVFLAIISIFFQNVLAILSYFLKISYHFFYDFLSFSLFKVLLYFIINCV